MSTTLDFGAHAPTVLSLQNLASLAKRFSNLQSLALPLAIAGVGLFTYLICNFIYNVYFHPYAKYPGPFLAKFTDLYAGYHAWKGDIHLDMWRCHQVYGDKVRYAPNRLNINTVTGLKSTVNPDHDVDFLLTLIRYLQGWQTISQKQELRSHGPSSY
jgi:hypothetical protein